MEVRRRVSAMAVALALLAGGSAGFAEERTRTRALGQVDDELYDCLALDADELRHQGFLAVVMKANRTRPRQKKRKSLDLTPLAEMAISYVQDLGIPLVEHRDDKGKRPVAVSASFAVAGDAPDLKFHLGDRPAEPMGAFYPPEKGFRFSVVYPVQNLTVRLEAGDDSEFGSLAVLGLSWVHPNKKMAAGFGLPMKLDNSESDFGAIFQFRMNLD